jgi:RNA polymerase sigma-70 factor (ECF subfamily)
MADAVLAEAARHGDLYAWERIVRRYQESVYRVAFLIVRDSALAEAATQSTFVRAYRALPSLLDDIGLLPWLIRIAAGEARQQRRESGRPRRSSRPSDRIAGPHFPASSVPGLDVADGLSTAEREVVGEAFDRLGEEDRLTLASRYLLGLSRADAANALAIASGLVDEHLHTALRRLRTRMANA